MKELSRCYNDLPGNDTAKNGGTHYTIRSVDLPLETVVYIHLHFCSFLTRNGNNDSYGNVSFPVDFSIG